MLLLQTHCTGSTSQLTHTRIERMDSRRQHVYVYNGLGWT